MARTTPRPTPTVTQPFTPLLRHCPCCGHTRWAAYHHCRPITTLETVLRLTLQIRRCLNPTCPQFPTPYRPEAEGRLALPKQACGLDVIAFLGHQRSRHHRSVPDLHHALVDRSVAVAQRTVTNLLERYDTRRALALQDTARLRRLTAPQGHVIFALAGVQPAGGHAVRWVLRDCLAGEGLLAPSLWSATHHDLVALLPQVQQALNVPIVAVVSDGQHSMRNAVQHVVPHPPHQLGHFHSLREAARPIYAADRHAKKARKKYVRGIRPIERQRETRQDPEAEVIRGYCRAVRRALTDDGRPPVAASGLKLPQRLSDIASALERGEKRGPCPRRSTGSMASSTRASTTPPPLGPPCEPLLTGFSAGPRC